MPAYSTSAGTTSMARTRRSWPWPRFLHLSRSDFARFLVKARAAVPDGGLLAFTLKEGDGEGWSTAKLGIPRYFVYWRDAPLREALDASGWEVLSLDRVMGRADSWLFAICRRSGDLAP